jgi:thioredoxin reductase (NADPH)
MTTSMAHTVSGWKAMGVSKPAVLLVDRDPEHLTLIKRAARERYEGRFDVIGAGSPSEALTSVAGLHGIGAELALILAEHRLGEITGGELLRQARRLFPDARRVLTADLSETASAVDAINAGALDYFLIKPWLPLEEKFFPIVDRLLDEWQASHKPRFHGIRLLGSRWSPESYAAKEFLSRNLVRYKWLEAEEEETLRELATSLGGGKLRLPVVFFPDGGSLVAPSLLELAEAVGLPTEARETFYDLVVVGSGPAGLANALYGASEGLEVLVLEQNAPGGQAGTSSMIENYLGFPAGVSGADLAQRAATQAKRFGAEILTAREVVGLQRDDPYRVVRLADGDEIHAHAVVIATGMRVRKLEAKGIEPFYGIGVFYGAAMTEAATYRGQDVCVVGGANSAGQGALFFSRYCRRVTMLVRAPKLAPFMSNYLVERIEAAANIDVLNQVEVVEACGQGRLESVVLRCLVTGETRALPTAAMFLFLGGAPRSEMFADLLERDDRGFLLTGPDLPRADGKVRGWTLERDPFLFETNVPGVFAAGDVRAGANRRVAAAVGEGSAAIYDVNRYLRSV